MANDPNTIQYVIQEDGFWYIASKDRTPGVPEITVSAKGVANGLSTEYNDGYDFGPDSYNPSVTSGVPLTQSSGIREAIICTESLPGAYSTTTPIVLKDAWQYYISETILIDHDNITIEGVGTIQVASGSSVINMFDIGTTSTPVNHTILRGFAVYGSGIADNFINFVNTGSTAQPYILDNIVIAGGLSNAVFNITTNALGPDLIVENCSGGAPYLLYSTQPGDTVIISNSSMSGDINVDLSGLSGSVSVGLYMINSALNTGSVSLTGLNATNLCILQGINSFVTGTITTKYATVSGVNFVANQFIVNAGSQLSFSDTTFNNPNTSGTTYLITVNSGATGNAWFTRCNFNSVSGATFNTASAVGFPVYVKECINNQYSNILDANLQVTVAGTTAGSFIASMPVQDGSYKKVIIYLDGYENDSTTAQTYTFPVPFATVAAITSNTASVPVVSTSLTEFSIAPDTTTAYTGLIVIEGY